MKTKTIGNLFVLNCDDPTAGFILQLAPQSQTVNSMHMSLEASKHVLDQIVDESADTFNITIDGRIVCTVDREFCVLYFLIGCYVLCGHVDNRIDDHRRRAFILTIKMV